MSENSDLLRQKFQLGLMFLQQQIANDGAKVAELNGRILACDKQILEDEAGCAMTADELNACSQEESRVRNAIGNGLIGMTMSLEEAQIVGRDLLENQSRLKEKRKRQREEYRDHCKTREKMKSHRRFLLHQIEVTTALTAALQTVDELVDQELIDRDCRQVLEEYLKSKAGEPDQANPAVPDQVEAADIPARPARSLLRQVRNAVIEDCGV